MRITLATTHHIPLLAEMNHQLIQDEGHRNPMSVDELKNRMVGWLRSDYSAALFQENTQTIGCVLWREEAHFIYIRQFFIAGHYRGQHYGKNAFHLLKQQLWPEQTLRLDALVTNQRGLNFWRSLGFGDYCITMEHSNP